MAYPPTWLPSSTRLASMSDAALLMRAMRPGAPRICMAAYVLLFFATVGALVLAIGPSATGGWTRALLLGGLFGWVPGLIGVLTFMLFCEARFGPIGYETELLRRAGWQPFTSLAQSAREQWTDLPGPGWLLLFYGQALPHGGEHFVQVTLFQDEHRDCPVRYGGLRWEWATTDERDPRKRVYLGTTQLTPDERDELFDIIAAGVDGATAPLIDGSKAGKHGVKDGYPFDLLALRRDPDESAEVVGNLADETSPAQPRRLAALLLDVAQRAGARSNQYAVIDRGRLRYAKR